MKTHREAGGARVHGAGMIAGCISYHPLHHHPAKTAPTNFLHWNSDEERREGHHQQKRNQQTPSLLNSWMNYDQTIDKHYITAQKATSHNSQFGRKDMMTSKFYFGANYCSRLKGERAKLVNLSKLVAIMHARAPMTVLIRGWDDHLVGQLTGCHLVHCCTLSLCYLGAETDRQTDDHHRNPNINTEIIWLGN